nr:MAG TPA: hypothetical protein [Caudoviricetes sp.]
MSFPNRSPILILVDAIIKPPLRCVELYWLVIL